MIWIISALLFVVVVAWGLYKFFSLLANIEEQRRKNSVERLSAAHDWNPSKRSLMFARQIAYNESPSDLHALSDAIASDERLTLREKDVLHEKIRLRFAALNAGAVDQKPKPRW